MYAVITLAMLAIGTGRVEPECPSNPSPATSTRACPDDGQGRFGREPGRTYFFPIFSRARVGSSGSVDVGTGALVATTGAAGSVDGSSADVRTTAEPGSRVRTTAARPPSPAGTPEH